MAQKRNRQTLSSHTTPPHIPSLSPKPRITQSNEDQPEQLEPNHPTNDPLIYRYRKRIPLHYANGKRDVHITRSAQFAALKARIFSLLDDNPQPVVLHAMGAAVTRACDLALVVQRASLAGVSLDVRTGTVVVHDDYEPLVEGYPEVTRTRNKSSVHITLRRTKDYV